MNRYFLTIGLLVALTISAMQAEAQKRKKTNDEYSREREELMKELKDLPPEEAKKIEELMKQADENFKKFGNGNAGSVKEDTAVFFPSKVRMLSSPMVKIVSRAEMQNYVRSINGRIMAAIPVRHRDEINKLAASFPSQQMAQLAVAAWYYRKAPVTAVALAAQAADKNPDDLTSINNVAAFLNQANLPEMAIPLLLYLLEKLPAQPMLLNNIGQSYALLGDKDNARRYLTACIKLAPRHPEANCTLGYIAASEGDFGSATRFAEVSLAGGFNMAASDLLWKVEPKDRNEPVFSKVDLPDYFNEYKLKLPRLQLSVDEGNVAEADARAFSEAIERESEKLYDVYAPLEEKGVAHIQLMQQQLLSDPGRLQGFGRSFSALAKFKLMRSVRLAAGDQEFLQKSEKNYRTSIGALELNLGKKQQAYRDEYAEKMKGLDCGEGRGADCAKLDKLNKELCDKLNQTINLYLKDRASVTEDYRRERQLFLLKVFYFKSYWQYMAADNSEFALAAYYKAAQEYVESLAKLGEPYTIGPACGNAPKVEKEPELTVKWTMDCPVDISLVFAVGSLKVNCDEVSFSMGEGAQFSFTQQFKSRQSTFTIGVGASISKEASLPGVDLKVEASVNQTFYISYDGINKITDLGMKFGAGVSAGYGFSGSLGTGKGIVTGVGVSKDGASVKAELGYTIGINSGYGSHIDFEDGPLNHLFAPEGR